MQKISMGKIGAVLAAIFLIGSMLVLPMSGAVNTTKNAIFEKNPLTLDFTEDNHPEKPIRLDTVYIPEETTSLISDQNDIGYNTDAGNRVQRSIPVYVGEPVDQEVPGRGRTGSLDPNDGDEADYYRFTVCEGQSIQVSMNSGENYDIQLMDISGSPVGTSYLADRTGIFFAAVTANEGAGAGEYTFSATLSGQNDAGTGADAGDDLGSATAISPGIYTGYMSINDQEDWYSFSVNSGQGIFVTAEPLEKSDYDIHLYNPSGELVHSEEYYGRDELEFPADESGTWKIQLDMFPGWDASIWPDNYFLYGSGAYELELSIGGTASSPPGPIGQPDVTPIAQSFIVNYDENSNADEYGYIAAVPAANYLDDGKRYVSPIFYQGCDDITEWSGTVDDTTQYLIDDWNTYLDRHDMVADEYVIPSDPVQAAAGIATSKWSSSDTVVLAVDGSVFEDEIETIFDTDSSLNSDPEVTIVEPGTFTQTGAVWSKPMFLGNQWGALQLIGVGDDFGGDTGIMTPKLHPLEEDWWPYPYDFNGPDYDTFFPVTQSGIWMPYVTSESGLEELQVLKIPGDRYSIPVDSSDSSIEVTISNGEASTLIVYLVDPEGNLRKPNMPHYNGGEIKPIHYWNGGHWQHDYDEFRSWLLEPHDDFTVSIHYPMEGKWTAIVVPFVDEQGNVAFSGNYHINALLRKHNINRVSAALSASNAAVIASSKHAPLLYVTEDSIPSETSNAITQLGATNIIFVNINEISSATPGGSLTEYTSMQQVIDAIKADTNSENYITITSLGSGDGYFAPSSMIAAYHVSPVLNIGEAPDAYNKLGQAATWREYGGDYYHGCLSLGHLPDMSEPIDWVKIIKEFIVDGTFPPLGLDLKLRWMSAIYEGVHEMIDSYGLDIEGKEGYMFVADRENDIRDIVCRAMMGNMSYAGHIPGTTSAYSSAHIVRDIIYPAIIYSNPGRDTTTSQMMNFPDGWQWRTNDGVQHTVLSSREIKKSFSSHGRFFEGHAIWDNLLERYNEGASISYYSGHGTGGSGISAMYENVEEQFPFVHLQHENLKTKTWWDAWRGYMYDDPQTKSPRWGGFTWYNSVEPNLYDFIHFKWADELYENLHSMWDLWMSCTTQAHLGPNVALSHGAALCFGNAGTGLCPQADLLDDSWMRDVCIYGDSIGVALSEYWWLHQRDYTTLDPTTIYGVSSMQVTNMQVIFGDPSMILYSPDWIEPVPITA
jgi:hypothetical protein